jgi:hypothetical protein
VANYVSGFKTVEAVAYAVILVFAKVSVVVSVVIFVVVFAKVYVVVFEAEI